MPRKLAGFFLFLAFWVVPFSVFSETIETQISADTITVERGEVLEARGNVVVQHGSNSIKADGLRFNKRLNELKFKEIREFYDGKAIRLSADAAELSDGLSSGIISAAKLLLDETIQIQADKVNLKNGEISIVNGISRVTSCEECEGKEPNWYLTASSAQRDAEDLNIVYKNVTVRVKGLPVAYIPYLRMPDPSVERARGFLVPEAALTSNLATGFKLPYFIPIGPSRDLLITPYLSSKTNTFEYRYREKFATGDLLLKGAFSNDELLGDDLRYFSQAVGSFKLGYGINLNFNLGKVGDTSYLGDYAYSDDSDLDAQITVEKTIIENQQFFEGDLSYLSDNDQEGELGEYFSLSGSYIKNINQKVLPGKLTLSASLNSSLSVNDDNSFSRPPSSTRLGLHYNQKSSMGAIQLSNDLYGNLNSFVNSADSGTANEEFSSQYGLSTLITYPLKKRSEGKVGILTPKISLSLNGQENDILGDFFIGSDELSWGNIFSGTKVSSLTESEKGLSVSMGLESKTFWETGHRMGISLAASKIGGLTYSSNVDTGLTNRKFNYLGNFSYGNNKGNGVSANALFSSAGKLLNSNFRGKYVGKKINLEGLYEIVDNEFDSRLTEDLKALDFLSSYNFADYFNVNSGFRFDLMNDQMAKTSLGMGLAVKSWEYNLSQEFLKQQREKLSLSAIYDDECTRLIFSFENRYQVLGSSKPVKTLTFRVQLKPLANVVFSQGSDQITF